MSPPIRSQLLLKLERRKLKGRWRPQGTLLCVNCMTLGQYLKGQMRSNVVKFAILATILRFYADNSKSFRPIFLFFFHYTTEHTFWIKCGEFPVNPTTNMAARSLLRGICRRLRRDRPTLETRQSRFCVYTVIIQIFTSRFSNFLNHKISWTFLSLHRRFDANRS